MYCINAGANLFRVCVDGNGDMYELWNQVNELETNVEMWEMWKCDEFENVEM